MFELEKILTARFLRKLKERCEFTNEMRLDEIMFILEGEKGDYDTEEDYQERVKLVQERYFREELEKLIS